jgi:hypothetical protein
MLGWLKSWWDREVCTSDQTLISQWETDVSKLPIIQQHYKDGTIRVLMPSEVKDLYDIQMGAYVLPDDHELTLIQDDMDQKRVGQC